jgi:hypothetical protein
MPTGFTRCMVASAEPRVGLVESAAALTGMRPLLQAYVSNVTAGVQYLG